LRRGKEGSFRKKNWAYRQAWTHPWAVHALIGMNLGVHEPDFATAQRLAETLKVPTAYLFAEDERLARMILAFEQLSVAEKDQLLKGIEST
jgi:hypothetical protein